MNPKQLVSIIGILVLIAIGCDKPERGEYRKGRYSWNRAAKLGEFKRSDLPGVYTCLFTKGSSRIHIKSDGTYTLKIRDNNGHSATAGPCNWYVQGLDGNEPAVVLEKLPVLYAVMEQPLPKEGGIDASDDWNTLSMIGFNKQGDLVLAIGVDPDNYYYFPRGKK